VEQRAFEVLDTLNSRSTRVVQYAGGGDDDIRTVALAVFQL
jgi:hypothetical protein